MKQPLDQYFSQRKADFESNISSLSRKSRTIGWVRLICFLLFIGFSIYAISLAKLEWALLITVIFTPIFGWLIKSHNRSRFLLKQQEFLIQINEEESQRIAGNLKSLAHDDYTPDPEHPFALDMDVFGSNSLYQLLNRSRLKGAQETMNQWLLHHANPTEVAERQEAIKELQSITDWRQIFTAYSYHQQNAKGKELTQLMEWFRLHFNNIDKPIFHIAKFTLPLLTLITIYGWSQLEWGYYPFTGVSIVNLFVLRMIFSPLMDFTKEFDQIEQRVKSYTLSVKHIQSATFQSKRLQELQNQLTSKGQNALHAIKGLERIVHFLSGRTNMLYPILNVIFLFDMFGLHIALKWKKHYENKMETWLDAIHNFHTLSDISSYAFANPSHTFPSYSKQIGNFSIKGMGHPLIAPEKRVLNDFEHSPNQNIGLITGSNMSGKSTFLRTIGVNLVLAQMGAPVCASSFSFSNIQVFSSMRTQDNLEESVSSFYAELKRLKLLLTHIENGQNVYFLLDEILKGTNSEDRHKGAISLIHQLIEKKVMGLVSTHDIQLSELSESNPEVINYSFNSTIEGDHIIFNYHLTDGPCKSFNASKLMEKMGIIR